MMRRLLVSAFTLLFSLALNAQLHFTRVDTVPVLVNTQSLLYPWAGGINFAQFSDIDLNQDGIMDLFVFDRTGNKITTYINHGTANQVDYTLAPQYVAQFPKLHDWALMRDYNCDGKMDIFTAFSGAKPGIAVWKNVSTISGGLQFQLVASPLITDVQPNSLHLRDTLWVTNVDIPAIRDVDNDGDLDVLTFDASGVHVEFHRNMSRENYGVCDSLKYRLQTMCWGDFAENTLNANLTINDTCGPPPIAPNNPNSGDHSTHRDLHNGSCLECINVDNDNDVDILIGDISNQYMSMGRNAGDSAYAKMDSVDTRYPGYDSTLTMFIWNCAFHVDVDNDGSKDLIMSPDASNSSENYKSCWYYHNAGSNTNVISHFVRDNFLQSDMIELGEGAFPRLFDYDNDGDQDLFIGNYGYYSSTSAYASKIALYKNIGTTAVPSFKLITDDFIGLYANTTNIVAPVPTFGDLDGDGDADLLIGDATGKLHYYRKDPGPADNFVFVANNYMGIDVGQYSTPQLVDVDRDGLLDLIIGEQGGNVNYYHNSGTSTVPNFVLTSGAFGNVDVRIPTYSTGYSVPYLWDNNGSYMLLVGSERGWLNRYDNIDGNLTGTFTRTDSMYVSTREGLRIAPCLALLSGDSLPDLVLGNYSGGVSLYFGDLLNGMNEFGELNSEFGIYPNPAQDEFTLSNRIKPQDFPATFTMINMEGQIVLQKQISSAQEQIDISGFSSGIYICTLQVKNGPAAHQKLVIGR